MRNLKALLALLGLSALALACNPFKDPVQPSVIVTQTVTQTQNAPPPPAPSPSASPGAQQGEGPIVAIKVSFFAGSPGSGDKTMTVGEKGSITATPLNAQGIDPCEGVPNSECTIYSQTDIAWVDGLGASQSDPAAVIKTSEFAGEAYNRNVEAQNPGQATISAVFRGGVTVPPGSILITVEAAPQ
jgi:hypothetical protein